MSTVCESRTFVHFLSTLENERPPKEVRHVPLLSVLIDSSMQEIFELGEANRLHHC